VASDCIDELEGSSSLAPMVGVRGDVF
jgi:hypothetical protein